MDVEAVADELYGLTPGEFTAARDARAREARKAGDREAASAISALRKPTVVAWLVNQLARVHPEQVGPLLDLGAALREATASLSGPELRDLSRQRHQLVSALARQARVLGEQAGHRVTEDTLRGVEETLNAALSDPQSAEALAAGRLTEGLQHTGFGAAQVVAGTAAAQRTTGASGAPRASTPARTAKSPAKEEERTARRAELERQLGEAWAVARRTAEVRDDAEEAARSASRRMKEVSAALTRLREEVRRTEDELQEAEQERDRTNREHDAADQAARAARQQVTDLQRRLDRL